MCADPGASEAVKDIKSRLERLENIVIGGNGQGSILERLAALERSNSTQAKLLWTVLAAVLTSLVKQFI